MASSACEPGPGGPPVTLDLLRPGVAALTLRRPTERNVITHAWADAMLAHCASLRAGADIGVVLLRAQGPAFCVGADVREMARHLDDLPNYIGALIDHAHAAIVALQTLPMPV
ncbi:enoyl-CoA hydratase/isomerase family protein, partial [Hydrogenophaga sp.]|uniref:enoyl-CoA hydratase/isomerase family protein n=1 Tax=Hydrogenophaga sp. TaxID=1904254 RepID=UPI00356657F3